MGKTRNNRRPGPTGWPLLAVLAVLAVPLPARAAWQVVATDQGKRVEIDRSSITQAPDKTLTAKGRIVLDRPIVDPRTSASYQIIEVLSRFNCAERTHATLTRTYYKSEGEVLRAEEDRAPFDMPVRSGTPDDRLLREACRPKGSTPAVRAASNVVEKVNEAAAGLREANESLVAEAVKKELANLNKHAGELISSRGAAPARRAKSGGASAASAFAGIEWSYGGKGAPDNWGKLKKEYATCASGKRQSPIDLREGIAVDLEPIQFFYRPAAFRVIDSTHNLQMAVYGGGFELLGVNYQLIRVQFHRPSEITIAGKAFDMEAQLIHKSEVGKLAIVDVLLEKGSENPIVQMALNNLPLEHGGDVSPPALDVDMSALLPENRQYYTFMGSLTTPPCVEGVLWLVFKQPLQVSPEQLAIFQRLYPPNARPVQSRSGRIVKESR